MAKKIKNKETVSISETIPEISKFDKMMDERKSVIKKTFVELLKKNENKTKFDYNKYICGTGGKGLLAEALGAFNPYDKKLFQEVLKELEADGKLYHVGGTMYTTT